MSKSSRDTVKRQGFKDVRRGYWRTIAKANENTGIYSQENLTRMRKGSPPRRLAILRNKTTSETIEFHAPVELHHIFPLNESSPVNEQAFVEVYPWQHAQVDDSRKFNWEFVCWAGYQ